MPGTILKLESGLSTREKAASDELNEVLKSRQRLKYVLMWFFGNYFACSSR